MILIISHTRNIYIHVHYQRSNKRNSLSEKSVEYGQNDIRYFEFCEGFLFDLVYNKAIVSRKVVKHENFDSKSLTREESTSNIKTPKKKKR